MLAPPATASEQVGRGQMIEDQGILDAISSDTGVMVQSLTTRRPIPADAARAHILRELKLMEARNDGTLAGEPVYNTQELVNFYHKRDFRPVWLSPPGLMPQAYILAEFLRDSRREGLEPGDYHMDRFRWMTMLMMGSWRDLKAPPTVLWARMDILLTDAFFLYASHQQAGRVGNPDAENVRHKRPDVAGLLDHALAAESFRGAMRGLSPPHAGYVLLLDALAKYRQIATEGGWPSVAWGPSLRQGDRSSRVLTLRRRLAATGELPDENRPSSSVFDEELDEAVREFQRSHGLDDDGVVGKATLSELNVPVEERIAQIRANLERWRWLPDKLGERYIMVNIAGFWLDVVKDGKTDMSMDAIVGKDYSQTPVFSGLMTYMVLGPNWTVPRTIAVRDKLPLILKDPKYLSRHGYKVIRGWGRNEREVDPATVDWSKFNEDYFPYLLRQDPGPSNALGRVKFMFPNAFDVYIHDTPERWLFNRSKRTFSSGCIRISKPIELAEYLLSDTPHWSRSAILRTIIKWKEQTVRLPRPIPIHVLYFTVWVDEEGEIQFRDDIYGRDQSLLAMLRSSAVNDGDTKVSQTMPRPEKR